MQHNMIDWVRQYNAAGYGTVPSVKGKPIAKKFQNIKPNPDIISAHYLNYKEFTVILPADVFVIDIDPRNMTDTNAWRNFKINAGLSNVMKSAFVVKSVSGGFHVYLKKPSNLDICKTLPDTPGLEFLSGWVRGCGSVRRGKTYEAISGCLKDLPQAPKELLTLITKLPKPKVDVPDDLQLNQKADIDGYIDYLLKVEPAVEGANGDTHTFTIACRGREMGLSQETTLDLMLKYFNPRCQPEWMEEALSVKVSNAYSYSTSDVGEGSVQTMFDVVQAATQDFEVRVRGNDFQDDMGKIVYSCTGNGTLKSDRHNAINYMRIAYPQIRNNLRFNAFSGDIEILDPKVFPWRKSMPFAPSCWVEEDVLHLAFMLTNIVGGGLSFGKEMTIDAVRTLVSLNGYHPVRDYLESLQWDGRPRLDTWLTDYMGAADTKAHRAVAAKVLCGAVARVMDPGCKFDYVLVLESPQGIGKNRMLSALAKDKFHKEFRLDPSNKDTILNMRGGWIVEIGEMHATKRTAVEELKAFITRQSDRLRLPYDRTPIDMPRQCIFVGTVNPDELGYLTDRTGNRRFWCVRCGIKRGEFDEDRFRANVDQLWAEAVVRFYAGEKLFLPMDLEDEMESIAKDRIPADPWSEPIAQYIACNKDSDGFTTSQILEFCIGIPVAKVSKLDQARVAEILLSMGYRKHRVHIENVRITKYRRGKE